MNYKRILVGLDFSIIDTVLIRYAAMLAKHLRAEKVFFLYVDRAYELDSEVVREFPQLAMPQDDYVAEQLNLKVSEYVGEHDEFDVITEVRTGIPVNELVSFVRQKRIDLLLVGHKHQTQGHGVLGSRLVDRSPCPVLFVPEDARIQLRDLMVCTDFSPYSRTAFEAAASFAQRQPGITIHCLHVYDVPTAPAVEVDQIEAVMRGNAANKFNQFICDFDCEGAHLRPCFTNRYNRPLGSAIVNTATRAGVDLIITGSRGTSWPVTRCEGSTPQLILSYHPSIPLLVAKSADASREEGPIETAHQLGVGSCEFHPQ